MIQHGSSGADVRRLQRMLERRGFAVGPADGVYGAKTTAAVKAFQTKRSLQIDGIVGPKTMEALNWNRAKQEADSEATDEAAGDGAPAVAPVSSSPTAAVSPQPHGDGPVPRAI